MSTSNRFTTRIERKDVATGVSSEQVYLFPHGSSTVRAPFAYVQPSSEAAWPLARRLLPLLGRGKAPTTYDSIYRLVHELVAVPETVIPSRDWQKRNERLLQADRAILDDPRTHDVHLDRMEPAKWRLVIFRGSSARAC